eukprot:gene19854-23784_t
MYVAMLSYGDIDVVRSILEGNLWTSDSSRSLVEEVARVGTPDMLMVLMGTQQPRQRGIDTAKRLGEWQFKVKISH